MRLWLKFPEKSGWKFKDMVPYREKLRRGKVSPTKIDPMKNFTCQTHFLVEIKEEEHTIF